MDYEDFIFSLMDAEPAVYGGAVINPDGELVYQTENWEISDDVPQINEMVTEVLKEDGKKSSSLHIMKLKYMVVEFTPERIIATNVKRKGHVIVAPVGKGKAALVTYIDPARGPRDALFNVQNFAGKLEEEF